MDPWETVATLLDSEVPYGHRKSRDRAAQLKEKGNAYFSKSQPADTLRAVRLYTEVLTKLRFNLLYELHLRSGQANNNLCHSMHRPSSAHHGPRQSRDV